MRIPTTAEIARRFKRSSLTQRLTVLMALSTVMSMLLVSMGTYFAVRWSLFTQLDKELTDVAAYVSEVMGNDTDNLGGLNAEAMRAGNATVLLLRSDGQLLRIPGDQQLVIPGEEELAIARTQLGSSARTGSNSDGVDYRMVSIPTQIGGSNYALVLGRPMAPTDGTLATLVRTMSMLSVIGIVVSIGLGLWTGRQTIRPVHQLSGAVKRVTETDELLPIEVTGDDEVADLTRSFNTMMVSLLSSRDRQKRLISDAGHELRTPLTSMRTNVELLVADSNSGILPPEARQEILRDVSAQLTEFTALVGDLVQLSRDEEQKVDLQEIDLSDVVDTAVGRVKLRAQGVQFDVHLESLPLLGDAAALGRAVTNLLDNAVKFSPPDGTVHVMIDGNLLRVSDEGPGIAEEDLPHVFERFYRSDRSRNTPGTGLGLSIVDHTIRGHGGVVEAGNAEGGGALFTVWLPGLDGEDSDKPVD